MTEGHKGALAYCQQSSRIDIIPFVCAYFFLYAKILSVKDSIISLIARFIVSMRPSTYQVKWSVSVRKEMATYLILT